MAKIVLSYKLEDLQQEVEKRTSYLGRMRSTENSPHLYDKVALTKGETFLYQEYLQNVISEIISYLQPWIRNINNPYIIYPDAPIHNVKHDLGVYAQWNGQQFYKGKNLTITNPQFENGVLTDFINSRLVLHNGNAIIAGLKITIGYTTYIPNTPVINYNLILDNGTFPISFAQQNTIFEDNGTWEINFPLQSTELGNEQIKSVDWIKLEIEASIGQSYSTLSAKKGEYVIVEYPDNTEKLFLLNNDWQEGVVPLTDVATIFDKNYLNAILFNLDMPQWWNNAMLGTAKRQLRETLVNGIIAQWLEIVLPDEAERFALKAQAAIENTIQALNAENKPLNRAYNMF